MDKAKIKDYATSLLFFGVAAVVAYQGQIIPYVPQEYMVVALIGFGILSQIAADARVKGKIVEVNDAIDVGQAEVEKYQEKVEELQKLVDEKQAEIEKVAGLKELDAA